MTHRLFSGLIVASFFALPACASTTDAVTATTSTASAVAAAQASSQTLSQADRFAAWKADFIRRAIERGYNPDMVRAVITPAEINEKALERDSSQPEFTRPIWSYVDNAANATRLNGGRSKLSSERNVFNNIEARYYVDRHVLTAIWGLESAYGKIMGNHDIISSLATFAFEGRRTAFGEKQLFAALDMIAGGYVRPEQLKGSWAGAMGMMQFIPTTFRDYAVDFNNDGNRDHWGSSEDALASAAHYLSRHGWRWNEPVMIEVKLPDAFDYALADGTRQTVNDWTVLGVAPYNGARWPQPTGFLDAKLLVPAGANGPKFLTFKNFDVIKKYNNSTSYAMGIHVLAEGLKGRAAIQHPWPRGDKALSRTDKEAMQRRLTELGYDTGGVDGMIGPNSRKAIRAWQSANGLTPDAYVNQAIFQRIMGR